MSIVWAPEAIEDLEAALDYLRERNRETSVNLARAVVALVERLAREPIEGPVHRLRDGQTVRGWPLPPFRIYYVRSGGELRVARVYHQKRAPIAR